MELWIAMFGFASTIAGVWLGGQINNKGGIAQIRLAAENRREDQRQQDLREAVSYGIDKVDEAEGIIKSEDEGRYNLEAPLFAAFSRVGVLVDDWESLMLHRDALVEVIYDHEEYLRQVSANPPSDEAAEIVQRAPESAFSRSSSLTNAIRDFLVSMGRAPQDEKEHITKLGDVALQGQQDLDELRRMLAPTRGSSPDEVSDAPA
ncbi:MAG: hypothetical protein Q4F53_01355 [Nesterenkonia sp.]|nr:hypothetical protein [Nesterenkonia sp.]